MYQDVSSEPKIATGNQFRYVKAEMAGAGTYMIAVGHLVHGPLDRERLHEAARALVQRHEALRTSFRIDSGTVTAHVSREARFEFHAFELADRGFETFRQRALPLIFNKVDTRKPGSLVRFWSQIAASAGGSP